MACRYTKKPHAQLRIKQREDGGQTITGYAAVFYDGTPATEYELWNGLVERVFPDAFMNALARPDDVRGLFNHDPNEIIGRNTAGTMRLSTDSTGLKYEIDMPKTADAEKIRVAIERGDVSGSSFSFDVEKQTFVVESKDLEVREIHGVFLFDVGPVVFPAYTGTTAGTRSVVRAQDDDLEAVRKAHAEWRKTRATPQKQGFAEQARARAVDVQIAVSS